jgi:hypothetical protein
MRMPPMFMTFKIKAGPEGKRFSIWFPIILVWLLLMLIMLPLLPILIVADLIFLIVGFRYSLIAALFALADVVGELNGLVVDVDSKAKNEKVYIKFN